MTDTMIDKEWVAIQQDEIQFTANTRDSLLGLLRQSGLNPDDYEILALPQSHYSVFI